MSALTTPITVELPVAVAERLREEAGRQKRPVWSLVRDLILEHWSQAPALPPDVEAELDAFHSLSDDLLWLVARSTLPEAEQAELSALSARAEALTAAEAERRDALLDDYDRVMIRRAQAAVILQSRGYDLSDPAVLQSPL